MDKLKILKVADFFFGVNQPNMWYYIWLLFIANLNRPFNLFILLASFLSLWSCCLKKQESDEYFFFFFFFVRHLAECILQIYIQ